MKGTFLRPAFYALMGAGLAWAGCAPAATPAGTDQVQVQLVASNDQVHPGGLITVGLHQQIKPGWHTYWLNPGDSGLATSIEWHFPLGGSAGEIQWPIPHRFTQGGLGNFGYDRDVTLLTKVRIPLTARIGQTFPMEAKAKWLVCQDVCIPQEATLHLALPVTDLNAIPGRDHPWIQQSRHQMPTPAPWPVSAQLQDGKIALHLPKAILKSTSGADQNTWFFPSNPGVIDHLAPQPVIEQDGHLTLLLKAGDATIKAGQHLQGVLVIGQTHGYAIDTDLRANNSTQTNAPPAQDLSSAASASMSLGPALLLALLGGMVLNLMPCVFPVLSIKALSMLSHSEQNPQQVRLHGLAYTLGVLTSFAFLAGLLIALKAGGSQAGWGFQFQSPFFVLLVAYLMFVVGLSFSGVFTIGNSVTGIGSSLASREGYSGSFFTGVLATVVATPCTAPFMGGAIGFALTQPPLSLMSVFLSLGLGLALPYLLLSAWPALQRRLPRPGVWMERVKQVLAFPMYGAAAWLVWVLVQQAGVDAVAVALIGMVVLAFGAWVYDSTRTAGTMAQRGGALIAILALIASLAGGYTGINTGRPTRQAGHTEPALTQARQEWMPYTPDLLSSLRAQGKPVFIDLTAAWCITCLVNERVALEQPVVSEAFHTAGIQLLKGDWTNQDPNIGQLLRQFGRSGVPLYVYYPNGLHSTPRVLPQVLTTDTVLAALKPSNTTQQD